MRFALPRNIAPKWGRLPECEVAIICLLEPERWGETLRWFLLFRRFGDPEIQVFPTAAQTNITSSPGSNQTVVLDTTWNAVNNTVRAIGAGGRGAHGGATTTGGAGANGGNFASITNCSLAAGTSVTVQVGAGATVDATAGGDSWFNDTAFPTTGTNKVGAKGGLSPAATSASSTAQTAITSNFPASNGAIGGQGGASTSNTAPGGGGGAAGPSGAGLAGKAGNDGTVPRAGGQGDNGTGGAGGVGTNTSSPGAAGSPGTEIGGVGSGGGGGGASASPSTGGVGGNYGGGGAGGGRSNGVGGNGANGIVILFWVLGWWDGLITLHQPQSRSSITSKSSAAIIPSDPGTEAPFQSFQPFFDGRVIIHQPNARVGRAAAFMPSEPGIEAPYAMPPGPPAVANIHRVPTQRTTGYRGAIAPWRDGAEDWKVAGAALQPQLWDLYQIGRRQFLRDVAIQNPDPLTAFQPFNARDWSFYDLSRRQPQRDPITWREEFSPLQVFRPPGWGPQEPIVRRRVLQDVSWRQEFPRLEPFRPVGWQPQDQPAKPPPKSIAALSRDEPVWPQRIQPIYLEEGGVPRLRRTIRQATPWTGEAETWPKLAAPATAAFYENPHATYKRRPITYTPTRLSLATPAPAAPVVPLNFYEDASVTYRFPVSRLGALARPEGGEWPKLVAPVVPLNFYENPEVTYRVRPPNYSPTRLSVQLATSAPVVVALSFYETPHATYRTAVHKGGLAQSQTIVSFDEYPPFYENPPAIYRSRPRVYGPTRLSIFGTASAPAPIPLSFYENPHATYRNSVHKGGLAQSLTIVSFDEFPPIAWCQDPQPPARRRVYGALPRPEGGGDWPIPGLVSLSFFENPLVTYRYPRSRSAALAHGTDPETQPFVRFFPFGWPTQDIQPPRPAGFRFAATLPGYAPEIEPFVRFFPFGWPIQDFQPPPQRGYRSAAFLRPEDAGDWPIAGLVPLAFYESPLVTYRYPTSRSGALAHGTDPEIQQFVRFSPFGWPIQDFQPPRLRSYQAAAFARPEGGGDWPILVAPSAPFNENALVTYRYPLSRAGAIARGSDAEIEPFIQFLPFGWPTQDFQPPRSNAYRLAATIQGYAPEIEQFVRFLPFGWPAQDVQPPRSRSYKGAGLTRPEGGGDWPIPGLVSLAFYENPLVTYRYATSRSGAIAHGSDPEIQQLIQFFSYGWPIQSFQPPHTNAFRAAAIMPIEPGIEAVYVFVPPPIITSTFEPTRFIVNMGHMMNRRGG